eukprot:534255-Amphidinium_carterae.1
MRLTLLASKTSGPGKSLMSSVTAGMEISLLRFAELSLGTATQVPAGCAQILRKPPQLGQTPTPPNFQNVSEKCKKSPKNV